MKTLEETAEARGEILDRFSYGDKTELDREEIPRLLRKILARQFVKQGMVYVPIFPFPFGERIQLMIKPGILSPDFVASSVFASYLAYSPKKRNWPTVIEEVQLRDRNVIDMGCGSGIQAIVACAMGAKKVISVDIDPRAVELTKDNIRLNCGRLKTVVEVYQSDLFERVEGKADVILFNAPFFDSLDAPPELKEDLGERIVSDGQLIQRFFQQARLKLNPAGAIYMPWLHGAGILNHPYIRAREAGYNVCEVFYSKPLLRLNPAPISIFKITL